MTIPAIPAGAQLGGQGTAENQAAANVGFQAPAAPAAPVAPVTPQAPVAPVVPTAHTAPVHNFQQPVEQPSYVAPTTGLAPAGTHTGQAPVYNPLTGYYEVPAALQAPVEPPVQAPAAPVEQPEIGATYLETSVNHFAAEVGIKPEQVADSIANALKYNDPSLIDVRSLGNLTPEQQARATQLAQMAYQHTQAEIQTMQNTVYQVAGGQEQWNVAIQSFNANATDEAKAYVAYLADNAGNAKAAAEYVTKYVQESGLSTQVRQPQVQGGAGGVGPQALDRQGYMEGINQLELKWASRTISQAQYQAEMNDLDNRRAIGRRAGL